MRRHVRVFGLLSILFVLSMAQSAAPARHTEAEEEGGARAFREADVYWAQRRGELSPAILSAAKAKAATLPLAAQLPPTSRRGGVAQPTLTTNSIRLPPSGSWRALGPAPVQVGGTAAAYSGRVAALVVDPTTSGNNTTLYLGAANGGVWKSVNHGASWSPLTDDQDSLAVGAITLDPNNHNIVYVGTGEPNQSLDSYFGVGVLKSVNGGATWTHYGLQTFGSRAASISRIVVNPYNSNQLFVASTIGLFVSNDAGQTYSQLGTGLPFGKQIIDSLEINASVNPPRLYVTIRQNGLYRSTDGGQNWTWVTAGLPAPGEWFRSALAVAPSNPNVIYTVITSDAYNGNVVTPFGYNGGYFSTDGGSTWNPLTGLNVNFTNGGFGAQGWYDLALAVDPRNYNVVYGAGVDLAVTVGGTTGAPWSNISSVYGAAGTNNSGIHPDQHAIAFGNCGFSLCDLYVGNDGGVYHSSNPTAPRDSVSYANLNSVGLAITEFVGGDLSANFAQQGIALGGTQDNGTVRFTLGGSWPESYGGDGGFAQINPVQPNEMYTENFYVSLLRSADQGYSWGAATTGLTGDSLFYMPYQLDRSNPRHLVAGTTSVFESVDGALSWYQSSPVICLRSAATCDLANVADTATHISAVSIAPTNSAIIYAGTADGQMFMTSTGAAGHAATFTRVNDFPFAGKYINQITIDSLNPNLIYVAVGHFKLNSGSGYVYRSTDGGASWTDISGTLPVIPVNSLVAYYSNTTRVLVIGTDIGVFFSTNEGTVWQRLGSGLPNTAVVQLALDTTRSTIIAYTHGRSAWAIPIPSAPSGRGDGIGIWRASMRAFYLRNSLSTGYSDIYIPLPASLASDQPLVGDWNGDGYDTVGLYRNNGIFLLWDDNSGKINADYAFVLGNPGDVPLSGDWTGRGRSGVGIFRPSNGIVYLKNNLSNGEPDFVMVYGDPGDVPLAGDWNGDGLDSIGIYQRGTGLFHLTDRSCWFCIPQANYVVVYGNPGWVVFSGDWSNSGRSGLGAFNQANGLTYLRNDATTTGYSDYAFFYGVGADVPVAGRWLNSPGAPSNPSAVIVPDNSTAGPRVTAPIPTPTRPHLGGLFD